MKHAESRALKKQIAEAMREGMEIEKVMERFQVNADFVYMALKMFRVLLPANHKGALIRSKISKTSTFTILRELLYTHDSIRGIGKKLGISHQRVSQILTAARNDGIRFVTR